MIKFSKFIWLYLLISGLVIIPGVYSLLRFGLRPSIDFVGGTLFEIRFSRDIKQSDLKQLAENQGLVLSSIQQSGSNAYLLRTKEEENEKFNKLLSVINASSTGAAQLIRQESVGPVLGKELLGKAVAASILAVCAILIYVAYAFKNFRFGLAGILALAHDILVLTGSFSLLGHFFGVEVDTLFVTAVLTTMSFSMHDTIVIFDRIREYQKKGTNLPLEDLSDIALTQTLGRSITNSMTIIFMLIALVLMGGASVKWFTVALLIGTVSGTYSSDFVAVPILLIWEKWDRKLKKSPN